MTRGLGSYRRVVMAEQSPAEHYKESLAHTTHYLSFQHLPEA